MPCGMERWYQGIDNGNGYYVFRGVGHNLWFSVWRNTVGMWGHTGGRQKTFVNREEAVKDLAETLVGRGYIIVSEEQAAKLEVLL